MKKSKCTRDHLLHFYLYLFVKFIRNIGVVLTVNNKGGFNPYMCYYIPVAGTKSSPIPPATRQSEGWLQSSVFGGHRFFMQCPSFNSLGNWTPPPWIGDLRDTVVAMAVSTRDRKESPQG